MIKSLTQYVVHKTQNYSYIFQNLKVFFFYIYKSINQSAAMSSSRAHNCGDRTRLTLSAPSLTSCPPSPDYASPKWPTSRFTYWPLSPRHFIPNLNIPPHPSQVPPPPEWTYTTSKCLFLIYKNTYIKTNRNQENQKSWKKHLEGENGKASSQRSGRIKHIDGVQIRQKQKLWN